MKFSKALWLCLAWVGAALIFDVGILCFQGQQKALEFLTGYVIEWSLSIDNLFVFFLIFNHFKLDQASQIKVLSWGILGAQFMRAIFILAGVILLKKLSWVIYAFGILLIFSAFKLFFKKNETNDPDQNFLIRLLKRFAPANLSSFIVVLIAVEFADLVFAVDSIPAVLAITKDPFIVYTSNIFAILGLRAMYFALSPVFDRFQYLHYMLGIILLFVGGKMLTDHIWHMPIGYAFGFIFIVLMVFTLISLRKPRNV